MAISRTDLFVDSGYSKCIIVEQISKITASILQTAVVLSNFLLWCLKETMRSFVFAPRTYDFIE